jgi:hypothetical protein
MTTQTPDAADDTLAQLARLIYGRWASRLDIL